MAVNNARLQGQKGSELAKGITSVGPQVRFATTSSQTAALLFFALFRIVFPHTPLIEGLKQNPNHHIFTGPLH